MMPSIDLRLASMIRSVEEVLLPALAGHSGLAQEQAHLLLGQLMVLRMQVDGAVAFERIEASGLRDLARDLVQAADGGERTKGAARTLATLLEAPAGNLPADIRTFMTGCSVAIEDLVAASGEDGSADFRSLSADAILRHGRRSALRNRSWFAAMNFEAPGVSLPPINPLVGD